MYNKIRMYMFTEIGIYDVYRKLLLHIIICDIYNYMYDINKN